MQNLWYYSTRISLAFHFYFYLRPVPEIEDHGGTFPPTAPLAARRRVGKRPCRWQLQTLRQHIQQDPNVTQKGYRVCRILLPNAAPISYNDNFKTFIHCTRSVILRDPHNLDPGRVTFLPRNTTTAGCWETKRDDPANLDVEGESDPRILDGIVRLPLYIDP